MKGPNGICSDDTSERAAAARRKGWANSQGSGQTNFAPEFMNRIDKVVVFHPLRLEQLNEICEIELGMSSSAFSRQQKSGFYSN